MPPIPNGFIAYVHASFKQEVFYISQRKRKPHIEHNYKLDHLRAGFEIAKGYWCRHGSNANIQQSVGQGGLF